ncbi:DUF4344 domain-containing metallopeptidase [Streptomyces sp. NPDC002566]|uniref:DUF4344 domain-containing metallopeptidase n=1 Tax=Streptomyces sp. NPDC002566 TaxID=3364650 RepID=UPI00369C1922
MRTGARAQGSRATLTGRSRAWLVALAALTGGAACGNAAVPGPGAQDPAVVVRFEEPAPSDRASAAFLRERGPVTQAAAAVTDLLTLDRPVPLVVRSCDGDGSSYDPESRRIDICYEEVSEAQALFARAGRQDTDDAVAAVLQETVFHETAHAVVDALDVRTTGREEDFADQFAALMLLRQGAAGERRLRAAADAWSLLAATAENADGDAEDEHSPDRERAVSAFCHLYGSAPGRHQDLVRPDVLPLARARGCAEEWAAVRDTWLKALGPALREG